MKHNPYQEPWLVGDFKSVSIPTNGTIESYWRPHGGDRKKNQIQFLTVLCKSYSLYSLYTQWIGLRENLQETPIFNGKNHGFLQIFP
jgi:hypothetical protein